LRWPGGHETVPLMNAKTLFRGIIFLLLLFVMLYVGMENPHRIDFYFPALLEKKISQPAALLFFGMFAVGVIAGMMLNSGGDKKSGESESRKKK
jgi:uncharacterized integral membrane protein